MLTFYYHNYKKNKFFLNKPILDCTLNDFLKQYAVSLNDQNYIETEENCYIKNIKYRIHIITKTRSGGSEWNYLAPEPELFFKKKNSYWCGHWIGTCFFYIFFKESPCFFAIKRCTNVS